MSSGGMTSLRWQSGMIDAAVCAPVVAVGGDSILPMESDSTRVAWRLLSWRLQTWRAPCRLLPDSTASDC